MQENNIMKNWFSHRHVAESVLTDFNVYWGSNPIIGECIVIPVLDHDGNFLFNKYRRNPLIDAKPKYLYDKGGKVTLYGWWKAKKEKRILITEGELDSLVAWSKNIPAISSTGGAMSFQEEWKELLADKEIILCFDNDHSGGEGMARALKFLPDAYIVFIPDRPGMKDLTDYVSSGGDIAELLKTKKQFKDLQDVIDDRLERIATFRSTWFHDAYITINSVPEFVHINRPLGKELNDDILMAKNYPIPNLLKFNYEHKAQCIWHNEKTPSLHYYKDTNSVYCFGGCGRHGDAIDVYRQINNCSFKEAVKAINKLI